MSRLIISRRGRNRNVIRMALAAGTGIGALSALQQKAAAQAQTYVWTNPSGGSWSTDTNWNTGTAPLSSFNNQILFNTSGASYTSNPDIGAASGPFNLNSLTSSLGTSTDSLTLDIGGTFGDLNFGPDSNNDTPSLIVNNTGTLGIETQITTAAGFNATVSGSANLTFGPGNQGIFNFGAGTTITNSGSGKVLFGVQGTSNTQQGFFFGNNTTITNSGTGSVQLADNVSLNGNVSSSVQNVITFANPGGGSFLIGNLGEAISGTVNVTGGPVSFNGSSGGNLFGNFTVLNVDAGASFNFNSNGETMGGISGAGNIIEGTAGITATEAGNRSFTGVISGSGAFSQDNTGTLIFGGVNTYTGGTTITDNGTLSLTIANAIAKSSAVAVNAGTLAVNGFSQSFNNLSGANQTGSLPLGGATLTLNTSANVIETFFSPLTGSGNIVITGSGTQALLGLNSFTGNTTVTGGTLVETYEAIAGSNGTISVAAAGTLDAIVNNNDAYSFTTLTDNGPFIKDGSGTLTIATHATGLDGSSFVVRNGAVVLDHTTDNASGLAATTALSLGSASITLIGNASAASSETFNSTTLQGSAQLTAISNGASATINTGTLTRATGLGSTINFTASGAASITTATANNASTGTLGGYATYNGTDWAVSGSGTGPFTVAPLAAASYSANTFSTGLHTDITSTGFAVGTSNASTGDIRFNTPEAATLTLNGTNAVSNGGILVTPNVGANTTTITGGTLNTSAGTDLVFNQFNTQGSLNVSAVIANTAGTPIAITNVSIGTAATTQTLTLPAASIGSVAIGDLVTVKNASGGAVIAASANWQVVAINAGNDTVTVAYNAATSALTTDTVSFTPETNVIKSGPGSLTLSGNNTFKGTLFLNQGTIVASVINNYGSTSSGTGSLYFNGGTLVANANFAPGIGASNWIVGPAGGTINIGTNLQVTKYGSTLYGSGNLTLTGSGTFDVGSNVSTFSGQIFDNSATIQLTSNQLRNVTGITIGNGAQYHILDTANGPFNLSAGAVLTLNGNGPSNTGAWNHTLDEAGSADYAFNSAVYLQTTSRFVENLRADGGVPSGFDGNTDLFPLPITGPGNLIKDGTGTLVLANAFNSYGGANGSTIISDGILQLGVNSGVPTANTLQFGETGSTNSGTFDMNGWNQSIAGLTTAGSGTAHQIINSNTSGQSVLTVNYNGSTNQIFTSQIGGGTVSSPNQSNIALVKGGTGTLSLLGTTTYTGTATVASGALRVTGNATSRGYIVNDGATLIVTNTDGTPLPATTMTLGNSGTTNLDFEFNGAGEPTSGAIAVSNSGGFTLNGTVDIAISSVANLTTGQFPLITYAGSLQGAGFAAINPAISLPSRVNGFLVNDTANNSIDLDITSIDFIKWSGAVNGNWDINTTANFALNSSGAATTYLDQPSPDTVVFDDTATGTHTVNLTTQLNPASVTVNTASSYTFTGSGSINGSTGLVVTGSGTLNLLTNNTYTGATTINSGTVMVGNGGTTGSLGTGNVTDNGSLIFNRSDDISFNPNITGNGTLTTQGGDTVTLNGSLSIGNVNIASGTLVLGAGLISGNITGAGSLTKSGPGLMAVAGNIGNTGTINISGGTLQIGNGGTGASLTNNVIVATAAQLGYNQSGAYTYSGNINGSGGVTVSQGTLELAGNLTYTGPTTIGANSIDFDSSTETDLPGLITGTGNIIQDGTGLVKVLNKDTGFTGNITINAGTMMLADEGARSALNAGLITINTGGRFIFGEGGILGENPDLPDTTFITIQGGTFELRVGEQYGATQLQSGTLLINGFGASQGITLVATSGPFTGFDLQSGSVIAENTGTGVGTLTSTTAGGGVNKTTAGTVTFAGPMTISSGTPIDIEQGILSFQAINVPATGTAGITIGGGPGPATLQMADSGSASIARTILLNSGASIDLPSVNSAPGGTLTLAGSVSGGELDLTGTGTLILSASDSYGGNTNIAGGTLVLATTGVISASQNIFVNPGSTFQLAGSTNASAGILTRSLQNLNISAGGLTVASLSSVHGNRQLIQLNTLSIAGSIGAWTGKFDLGNNDLDIHNASLATVTDQVKQGYNSAGGGNWNGSAGITSAAASNDPTHLTALGVILNDNAGSPLMTTFDGAVTADGDVLVKYTYYGDTNLDGQVDGTDYSRIDNGYISHLSGWYNGDFNYDGVIDGSDYTLIDNAYNTQGASLAAETAAATAQIAGGSSSAVPEPATLGLLAIGAMGLLGRRRRV